MSAFKKPGLALFGALALIFAGLFSTASAAWAYPAGTAPTCSVSDTTPSVGGSVDVSCASFEPGETVSFTLHSDSIGLGSVAASSDGGFSSSVQLPSGVSGQHELDLFGQSSGDSVSIGLDIGGSGGTGGTSTGSSGGLSSTGVAVIGIGALGFALLASGALMMRAGKRRHRVAV